MEHDLFIDGNIKEYTWTIRTGEKLAEQIREHPPAYMSGGKLDVKAAEEGGNEIMKAGTTVYLSKEISGKYLKQLPDST